MFLVILSIYSNELNSLLENFHKVTGFRIVVYDSNFIKLAAYPKKNGAFCSMIKKNPFLYKRCEQCDFNAFDYTRENGKIHIYNCHCGLTEVVSPLKINGAIVGYMMFGEIINPLKRVENKKKVLKYCSDYIDDIDALSKNYDELICKDTGQIKSCAKLMEVIASYLCMSNIINAEKNDIAQQISMYIHKNISTDISVNSICENFGIGKSKLFELSKRYFGVSIIRYVKQMRISVAKTLLTTDNSLGIAEVSTMCGFSNYNYFSNVFKKETGISPLKYKHNYIKTKNRY